MFHKKRVKATVQTQSVLSIMNNSVADLFQPEGILKCREEANLLQIPH